MGLFLIILISLMVISYSEGNKNFAFMKQYQYFISNVNLYLEQLLMEKMDLFRIILMSLMVIS